MEELIPIQISASAQTKPFVSSGTSIILIQDGTVTVGRLLYVLGDVSSIEIEHPINQDSLNIQAIEIVKNKNPEYLNTLDALLLTCPMEISNRMIWSDEPTR